ncbi:MAG TPA: hypothetical protein VM103_00755 [Candidatus Paceibacterota bacterium]|nr:hypothetical protein [Candidatus Paceibacterota bacterium]
MAIQASGGTVVVTKLSTPQVFVGSSGDGEFPPTGQRYERFSCRPRKGEPGILVFRPQPDTPHYLNLYQYWWEGDKIVVENHIKKSAREYSYSEEAGFMASCRGWHCVTSLPAEHTTDYLLVDLFPMLQYLEGKIGPRELYRNARSVKRRAQRDDRMSQLNQANMLLNAQLNDVRCDKLDLEKRIEQMHRAVQQLVHWISVVLHGRSGIKSLLRHRNPIEFSKIEDVVWSSDKRGTIIAEDILNKA